MGLFEKAGRKFQKLKETAEDAAEERAAFECAECGTSMYIEREECKECGAEDVVPVDAEADDADETE